MSASTTKPDRNFGINKIDWYKEETQNTKKLFNNSSRKEAKQLHVIIASVV